MAEVDDSYVTALNIVSWLLGGIIVVLTSARLFGRTAVIHHQAGWDDVFMACATVSAIICSALVTTGTTYGLGKHTADIASASDKSEAIKYTIIAPAWSIVCTTFGKLSVLTFLFRLMGVTTKPWHAVFLWSICFVMVCMNIMAIIVIVRFCDPPAAQWDTNVKGNCMDANLQAVLGDIQAAYNAFMDFVVALFPPFVIKQLNISTKMKIGLCVVMGGGVFAASCTIVKTVLISKNLANHDDITYSWAPITLWYTAEMDAIIIFGNVPTLWPLFRWIAGRVQSMSGGTGDDSYNVYQNASNNLNTIGGSEAFALKDVSNKSKDRGGKVSGPTTRALQDLDDMRTAMEHEDSEGSETGIVTHGRMELPVELPKR